MNVCRKEAAQTTDIWSAQSASCTILSDSSNALRRAGLPSSSEANLVIISGRAESYTSGFAYLFDYITPDQWAWPKGVSVCKLFWPPGMCTLN